MVAFSRLAVAAAATLLSTTGFAAPTAGDFDVVSMNVAGLPALFNGNEIPGDKATNSRLIGTLLGRYQYDIVHMQEDFNFHANIYETDTHPYRTATSGGVPFGSGLNSVSNFPWINFTRVKWNKCANASGADCLTPKGFTFMRVRVSDGVYVDVYNLHTDAGSDQIDRETRADNLKQVSDFININSIGNAVLVFGDTNSRYTRAGDGITIFSTANGMTDAWIQLVRGGVIPTAETLCSNPSTTTFCEIVDKSFFRGSKLLTLQATQFAYDSSKFLQADGSILSDHNVIRTNYTWSLNTALRQSDFYGGPHGTFFNDIPSLPASPKVASVTLRGSSRLDAVSLTLRSGQVLTHGGTGGTASSLTLGSGEFLTRSTACQAQKDGRTRIFYLGFTTSTGRVVQAGTRTSDCVDWIAETGFGISGFVGQSGDEIDQLAVVYARQ